jgi:hypothetical protein
MCIERGRTQVGASVQVSGWVESGSRGGGLLARSASLLAREVDVKALNQAVKRNLARFPARFHVPAVRSGGSSDKVTDCDLRRGRRRELP